MYCHVITSCAVKLISIMMHVRASRQCCTEWHRMRLVLKMVLTNPKAGMVVMANLCYQDVSESSFDIVFCQDVPSLGRCMVNMGRVDSVHISDIVATTKKYHL